MKYIARTIFVTGDVEEQVFNSEDEAHKRCRDNVKIFGDMVEYTHVRQLIIPPKEA